MHKISDMKFEPVQAFANFRGGLCRALEVSPAEIRARIAADNAQRTAARVQKGYAKRGPKPKSAV
jgi:hypothetical protein